MQKVEISEFNRIVEDFRRDKVPYILYAGTLSSKLETEFGVFYTGQDISMSELSFVAESKRYLTKRIEHFEIKEPLKRAKTEFFKVNSIEKGIYKDYVEIDLNSAYWNVAYRIGLLENSFYKKGLGKSKRSRLQSLGQLGKIDSVFKFDGKRVRQLADKKNSKFVCVWDTITQTNSLNIKSVIKNTNWLFYWVDAVFVHKDYALEVKSRIKKLGYRFKTKHIHEIRVERNKIIVYSSKTKFKEFNIKVSKYEIMDFDLH